jgi:hypothetical protein
MVWYGIGPQPAQSGQLPVAWPKFPPKRNLRESDLFSLMANSVVRLEATSIMNDERKFGAAERMSHTWEWSYDHERELNLYAEQFSECNAPSRITFTSHKVGWYHMIPQFCNAHWLHACSVWLTDCRPTDWLLADWLIVGWLTDCWLTDRLLADWLTVGWLTDCWLADWLLADWPITGWLTDSRWLPDWINT